MLACYQPTNCGVKLGVNEIRCKIMDFFPNTYHRGCNKNLAFTWSTSIHLNFNGLMRVSNPDLDVNLALNHNQWVMHNITCLHPHHNIIQIHNNVLWDWQCCAEFSSHSSKYCQSHRTLLWIWIMLCLRSHGNYTLRSSLNNFLLYVVERTIVTHAAYNISLLRGIFLTEKCQTSVIIQSKTWKEGLGGPPSKQEHCWVICLLIHYLWSLHNIRIK